MDKATRLFYDKRGHTLVSNLQKRHFDAWYCPTKEEALAKALEILPAGASIGWGGALSAQQIGLLEAVKNGNYRAINREAAATPEERDSLQRQCFSADYFLTGANALSLDGQMVNIDGAGNRVAAIIYGPKNVLVIAGMNKVVSSLEAAMDRARTVAAPRNAQRFGLPTPCNVTGCCAGCTSESSICNQIVITRNCRPAGRIKFLLVGEDLGF